MKNITKACFASTYTNFQTFAEPLPVNKALLYLQAYKNVLKKTWHTTLLYVALSVNKALLYLPFANKNEIFISKARGQGKKEVFISKGKYKQNKVACQ